MIRKKLNKMKLSIFILAVMCIFTSLIFGVYSFAKYTTQDSEKALVIPANFQFSSDYLKDTNPLMESWADSNETFKLSTSGTNFGSNINSYTATVLNTPTDVNVRLTAPNESRTYRYFFYLGTSEINYNIIVE